MGDSRLNGRREDFEFPTSSFRFRFSSFEFHGGRLGGREGIRTLGLSVANAALSQLSYAPTGTDFPNIA
jgi:hypothetical protein